MKTFFVGTDISKDHPDACTVDSSLMKVVDIRRADNTPEGITGLIAACRRTAGDSALYFCFEHTGAYGLLLAAEPEKAGIPYSAVPALEISRSSGMTRGKSDTADAQRIALYAATNRHKLRPSRLPGKTLMKVKALLSYRSLLSKMSRQMQNARKACLAAGSVVNNTDIITDMEERIAALKDDIAALDQKIREELTACEPVRRNFEKALTVKGIGLLIAAHVLVYTDNFTRFDTPRRFSCFAGLAPFGHSSGSSVRGRTRTGPLRNRTMKTLLFNGASSAAVHDAELKAYYKRKTAEGKHRMCVLNAVACKLVYRIFAVVNREEPYVNLVR